MKKKPIIFIQSIDIYRVDIIIACDATKEEIVKYLEKRKCKKSFIDWIKTDETIFEIINENKALFCWNNKIKGNLILLNDYHDNWEFWETLMHEIHHFIHNLSYDKIMEKEIEAQAYLFEFLFHSIRRKLQGIDKL